MQRERDTPMHYYYILSIQRSTILSVQGYDQ